VAAQVDTWTSIIGGGSGIASILLSAIFLVDLALRPKQWKVFTRIVEANVMARLGSRQMEIRAPFDTALKGISQLCPAAGESVTLRRRRIQWAWWVLNT
jgi:hypothetical protein